MAAKPKQYAVDVWYMEYREGTSDKFYQVMVSETGICLLRWGRRGAFGQHAVSRYTTYDEARDHGLKQVYAKKSKGYMQQGPDMKFLATTTALDRAQGGYPNPLVDEWSEAQRNGVYDTAKVTVLKHYSDFSDTVQALLHRAEKADLGTVTEEFAELEGVWEELTDKHNEVQAAFDLMKQTLFQKMMAGQL